MKEKVFILAIIATTCFCFNAEAQLTEGKNTAKVVRNGNRASEGDFGIYFGTTSNILKMAFDTNVSLTFMPLVNLKYMATDEIEVRLGIELNNKSEREKGNLETITSDGNSTFGKANYLNQRVENRIYPGVAYHFSNKNLLDVYVGGEVPLGYSRTKLQEASDDFIETKTTRFYHAGVGGFIGLQAYIANLPIAVGIEYGISCIYDWNLKEKTERKFEDGDPVVTYTSDIKRIVNNQEISNTKRYDNLKARKGEVGNQFRITLTYFFKN